MNPQPVQSQPYVIQAPVNGPAIVAIVSAGVAVVLGALALNSTVASADTPIILSAAAAVAAIVTGFMAWRPAQRGKRYRTAGTLGVWLGALALVAAIGLFAAVESQKAHTRACLNEISQLADPSLPHATLPDCDNG